MLSNQQVAEVFANIADAMEVLGEDRFKAQAYRRASEVLGSLPTSLQDYYARGALEDIPGVGAAISTKIAELLETGRLQFYERLRAKVPDGVLDVVRVPGASGRSRGWVPGSKAASLPALNTARRVRSDFCSARPYRWLVSSSRPTVWPNRPCSTSAMRARCGAHVRRLATSTLSRWRPIRPRHSTPSSLCRTWPPWSDAR